MEALRNQFLLNIYINNIAYAAHITIICRYADDTIFYTAKFSLKSTSRAQLKSFPWVALGSALLTVTNAQAGQLSYIWHSLTTLLKVKSKMGFLHRNKSSFTHSCLNLHFLLFLIRGIVTGSRRKRSREEPRWGGTSFIRNDAHNCTTQGRTSAWHLRHAPHFHFRWHFLMDLTPLLRGGALH